MAEAPTEAEILQAIARRFPRTVESGHPHFKGTVLTQSHQLVRLHIVRSIERRTGGTPVEEYGKVDLSDRLRYDDDIDSYPAEPPQDPGTSRELLLVERDSEDFSICSCNGGKVRCEICRGRGREACPVDEACPDCQESDPCTSCTPRARPYRSAKAQAAAPKPAAGTSGKRPPVPAPRISCPKCGTEKAACAGCRGVGRVTCHLCKGKGRRRCQSCEGSGKEVHTQCGGKGSITSYRQGAIRWTPSHDTLELPARSWPRWVADRVARDGDWEEVAEPQSDNVPDEVDEYRAVLANHFAYQKREVGREASVKRMYLARAELLNDPHRVFYVFTGKRGLEVMWLPSRRTVQRASAAVAGALVLLILLLVLLH